MIEFADCLHPSRSWVSVSVLFSYAMACCGGASCVVGRRGCLGTDGVNWRAPSASVGPVEIRV